MRYKSLDGVPVVATPCGHPSKLSVVGAEDSGLLGYVDDSYSGSDAYHLRQTPVVVQSQAHASLRSEEVVL
jgi:hypothetical protein